MFSTAYDVQEKEKMQNVYGHKKKNFDDLASSISGTTSSGLLMNFFASEVMAEV